MRWLRDSTRLVRCFVVYWIRSSTDTRHGVVDRWCFVYALDIPPFFLYSSAIISGVSALNELFFFFFLFLYLFTQKFYGVVRSIQCIAYLDSNRSNDNDVDRMKSCLRLRNHGISMSGETRA